MVNNANERFEFNYVELLLQLTKKYFIYLSKAFMNNKCVDKFINKKFGLILLKNNEAVD